MLYNLGLSFDTLGFNDTLLIGFLSFGVHQGRFHSRERDTSRVSRDEVSMSAASRFKFQAKFHAVRSIRGETLR